MIRGRLLRAGAFAAFALASLASLPRAAAETPVPEAAFELRTSWGSWRPARGAAPAWSLGDAPGQPVAAPRWLGEHPRASAGGSTEVTHVLTYRPRVVEQAPYAPGSPLPDHVSTALIVTGGAAILTSILVDWLR
jgi:hypothetical protein